LKISGVKSSAAGMPIRIGDPSGGFGYPAPLSFATREDRAGVTVK